MTERFKEIISTQKVIDTMTGKEYDCLIDTELLNLINELAEENKELQGKASSWKTTASEEISEKQTLMRENQMLKNTISRNECYIAKLTHRGEWSDKTRE